MDKETRPLTPDPVPAREGVVSNFRPMMGSSLLLSIPCLFPVSWLTPICFSLLLLSFPAQILSARKRNIFSNPMIYLAVAYFFGYVLDYYFYRPDEGTLGRLLTDPQLISDALLWGYRGYASMALAYNFTSYFNFRRGPVNQASAVHLVDPFLLNRILTFMAMVHLAGFILDFQFSGGVGFVFMGVKRGVEAPYSVAQIIYLMKYCSRFFVFFLSFMQFNGIRPSFVNKYVRWAVLATVLLESAGAGSKAMIFEHLLAFVIPALFQVRRASLRLIFISVSVAALILFTFNVITNYRSNMRDSDHDFEQTSTVESVQIQISVFMKSVRQSFEELISSEESSLSREVTKKEIYTRLGFLRCFALLQVASGGESPHENALATCFLPVTSFLPRSLVPHKVVYYSSGDLAKLLGWTYGGVSVTLIGSLYWTWGYAGILIGMAALGVLVARLTAAYSRSASFRNWFISSGMFYIILIMMLDVGKSIQDIAVAIVRYYIFLNICFMIGKLNTRRTRTNVFPYRGQAA